MARQPKVLLKFLGISLDETKAVSIDFAVLCGAMAALLGNEESAAKTLAEFAAGFKSPPVGKVVTGRSMATATSPEGKRSSGFISSKITAPPDMTVRGCISLAVTAQGNDNAKSKSITNELTNWLQLEDVQHSQIQNLSIPETQRCSMAIAMASNPELLIVDCPVHYSLFDKLKTFSEGGNTVLFRASSLGEIPPGVERIALCNENGICVTVRHSELAELTIGGAEISASFYPSLPREQLESIKGIRNLMHKEGKFKFTHSDTSFAILQLVHIARANSRVIVDLNLSSIPPSVLISLLVNAATPPPPADLFGQAE